MRLRDGMHIDRSYAHHVAVALGHRLPFIGPYLFYRSYLDPIMQAEWLAGAVLADRRLMTGAMDVEEISFTMPNGQGDRLSKTARETRIDRFIGKYEQLVKRRLVLYTTPNTADTLVRFANIPGARRVITWQAEWGPRLHPIPNLPAPSFWQTADHGGAGGGDTDICLHDTAFLASLVKPMPVVHGAQILGPWVSHPRTVRPGYRVVSTDTGFYEIPATMLGPWKAYPTQTRPGYRVIKFGHYYYQVAVA